MDLSNTIQARRAVCIALVALSVLALSGCGERVDTVEKMRERAELRDECEALRGTFIEWRNELGDMWRCEFESNELSSDDAEKRTE